MQVVQSVGRPAFLIISTNYFQIIGKQRLFCFDAKIIAHFLQNVCTLYSAQHHSHLPLSNSPHGQLLLNPMTHDLLGHFLLAPVSSFQTLSLVNNVKKKW